MADTADRSGEADEAELAAALRRTANAHHAAFAASDGVDPDWAIWYAGHLQATVGDRLPRLPSRAELTYLLVDAERAFDGSGADRRGWPEAYAASLLARLNER